MSDPMMVIGLMFLSFLFGALLTARHFDE